MYVYTRTGVMSRSRPRAISAHTRAQWFVGIASLSLCLSFAVRLHKAIALCERESIAARERDYYHSRKWFANGGSSRAREKERRGERERQSCRCFFFGMETITPHLPCGSANVIPLQFAIRADAHADGERGGREVEMRRASERGREREKIIRK